MSRHRKDDSDNLIFAIVIAVLGLFVMPLFGIYLLSRDNETDKAWGAVLVVFGTALWIAAAIWGR